MVVKLGGWDPNYAKSVARASLSALKQLILSDKKLPGTNNHATQLPWELGYGMYSLDY